MSIPFTQYLLPNGRRSAVTIKRPAKIEALAQKIIAAGCRFEIEMLQTGEVSMEILKDVPDPDLDDSVAMEICTNGPEVPVAVDKMVADAVKILHL